MRAYFPSFVCMTPESAESRSEVVSHWNPSRANTATAEDDLGRKYFWEAISFCRNIGAPFFMVCVLKEIRISQIGFVERAFLWELAKKASAGGISPKMADQEASSLAHLRGIEVEFIRGIEGEVRRFILDVNQNRRPDVLYAAILEWLRAPDSWIADVAAIAIAGAAMKGVLN